MNEPRGNPRAENGRALPLDPSGVRVVQGKWGPKTGPGVL
jgi:hypothetical protein